MNQVLSLLLALSLALGGLGAASLGALPAAPAGPAVTEEAPRAAYDLPDPTVFPELPDDKVELPQAGDTVYGFTVKEIHPFSMLGAQIVLFEHERTGAQLVYIANEDTNRVYQLTFLTDAVDNKGLPHVFEHSTLDGSRKYPSKTLFFNLIYQTYNTYMNAFTTERMTSYPVASLSEEQLLRYADYYTDSCLFPRIMWDESIFREEAWRYRLEKPEDELKIEGTVYSEMQGANTLARMANLNFRRDAFPGSLTGNDYGGSTEAIPDMTWQDLQEYHNKYYHPSNMVAYLYGSFQDYTAFLKLLDDTISEFEAREFTREDPGYTPITAYVRTEHAFPATADTNTDHTSMVYYGILCPGLEGEEQNTLDTLTDLMVSESSPISQAVRAALPTASFATYFDVAGPEPAVMFIAQNVNRGDADIFKSVVDKQLRLIAQNGFEQDFVDGVMASVSLSTLLSGESAQAGLDLLQSMATLYSYSGDLLSYQKYVDSLAMMDQWNREGRYQAAVGKWLTDSAYKVMSVTYPEPGLREKLDAAEKERLAAVKAAMSEEEIAALVKKTNAREPEEDSSRELSRLQAVSVQSLPEEIKIYSVEENEDELGVRYVNVDASVSGVGEADLFLSAAAVPQEDLHWMKLLTDLVGRMDTERYTREEAAVLASRYLYEGNVRVSMLRGEERGSFTPYIRMTWKGRDEDLKAGYDLMYERVFKMKLDDAQKLLEGVSAVRSALRSSIQASPFNVQLYRALGVTSPMYRYYGYVNQLEYYEFLTGVETALQEDPAQVTARLQAVSAFLENSDGAVAGFSGNKESQQANAPLAKEFFAGLKNHEEREAVVYDLPRPAESEALAIESAVQFNGIAADFETMGLDPDDYDAGLEAVTGLVLDKFLYPMLRDQYGAYSVFHSTMNDEGMYIVTYRDPNVEETYQVFSRLPDLLRGQAVDQKTLDGYILSAYVNYARSAGELNGAVGALLTTMEGREQDEALENMQALKAVTPDKLKKYADIYQALMQKGFVFSAGGLGVINRNARYFQQVLNPFGTKDQSQVTLSDVREDDPVYPAVRYVFENGLMSAKADDVFGVNDPATVDELARALFSLVGGAPDSAYAFFAQYGITDAPDAELTRGTAGDIIYLLLRALQAPEQELDGSAYADYTDEHATMLEGIAYGLMLPVQGENGQLLAADQLMNRGEAAWAVYALSKLLE